MKLATLEYCVRSTRQAYWLLALLLSPCFHGTRAFRRPPSPSFLRKRVHPLVSACLFFRVLAFRTRPESFDSEHLPWGFLPLRDSSRQRPHSRASQARFVPSSEFLTPSTVCSATSLVGLFHPTATYGISLQGFSLLRSLRRLVAIPCPLVVRLTFSVKSLRL